MVIISYALLTSKSKRFPQMNPKTGDNHRWPYAMHIVLTANTTWNIANFRTPIIKAARERGWRTTVICPPDDSIELLKDIGCDFVPLKMDAGGVNPASEAVLLVRLCNELRRLRPDVVLSYTIKNNLYAALSGRLLGIPVLPNVSGLGRAFASGSKLRPIAQFLYRRAFRNAPAVFVQNTNDRDLFLSERLALSDQLVLLPGSGIDLFKFKPTALPGSQEQVTFLLAARMLWGKGLGEYVAAAGRLKATNPKLRFLILGPVDDRARNGIDMATISNWVSEGAVEYLGSTKDVRPFVELCDCLVLPSFYREGVPRSLLEAASMGRAIITTNTPGCRDAVDGDLSGYICEPQDVESLAASMARYISLSPSERETMGMRGRAKMEVEFDERIVVQKYLDAIEKATGQTANKSP